MEARKGGLLAEVVSQDEGAVVRGEEDDNFEVGLVVGDLCGYIIARDSLPLGVDGDDKGDVSLVAVMVEHWLFGLDRRDH